MGNAYGYIKNDADDTVTVYVFNKADALRKWPHDKKVIEAGKTVKVEAAPHGSGLIVSTGKGKDGGHYKLRNGCTANYSEIAKADGNRWYDAALILTGAGCIAAASLTGGAVGLGVATLAGACAVGGAAAGVGAGAMAGQFAADKINEIN